MQKFINKAIFLDRDGTLIAGASLKKRKAPGYVSSIREIKILPGALQALKLFQQTGYLLVVVTNQSAVARGFFTEKYLQRINRHLQKQFARHGIILKKIYYCPHYPPPVAGQAEGIVKRYRRKCRCRKPEPGLLLKAKKEFGLNLKKSVMVGDSLRDIGAGRRAGTKTVLVLTGQGRKTLKNLSRKEREKIDLIAPTLLKTTRWIKKLSTK
ncbi:MAG: HAD family hydrolase [Planctomycetota bacterium]